MIDAAWQLRTALPEMRAAVAVAPDIDPTVFQQLFKFEWLTWQKNRNCQLMAAADVLLWLPAPLHSKLPLPINRSW
jgi:hypothetical protein